jgi:hypothetical protein
MTVHARARGSTRTRRRSVSRVRCTRDVAVITAIVLVQTEVDRIPEVGAAIAELQGVT